MCKNYWELEGEGGPFLEKGSSFP
ncbi:hypothetical protein HMPREF0178_03037, partial [Bilophila sp. 4_1_30]